MRKTFVRTSTMAGFIEVVPELDHVLKHLFSEENCYRDEGHGECTFEFFEANNVYRLLDQYRREIGPELV